MLYSALRHHQQGFHQFMYLAFSGVVLLSSLFLAAQFQLFLFQLHLLLGNLLFVRLLLLRSQDLLLVQLVDHLLVQVWHISQKSYVIACERIA